MTQRALGGFFVLWTIVTVPFSRAGTAACSGGCVPGGGPAATDCLVQFAGVTSTTVTCTDGDPSCDTDGTVNGVCAVALQVCINAPSDGCTSPGLSAAPKVKPTKDAASQALSTALGQLSPSETVCTSGPYLAPVKVAFTGVKAGVTKLAISAASTDRKKDRDKLVITCNPGAAPSLANVLQPIFTEKCATPACHRGVSPSGDLNMETGNTYADCVGKASVSALAKGLDVVEAGNVKKSYLARKILGKGLVKFDAPMPQGCPVTVPCLTEGEKAAILTWIQAGAPNN